MRLRFRTVVLWNRARMGSLLSRVQISRAPRRAGMVVNCSRHGIAEKVRFSSLGVDVIQSASRDRVQLVIRKLAVVVQPSRQPVKDVLPDNDALCVADMHGDG